MADRSSPAPTRRSFLRGAAAALGGLSVARTAHAAGAERIRVGMIGCGGRCTGAAAQSLAADPAVRLVAMADLFPDRIQTALDALRRERPGQVEVDAEHRFTGFDGYREVIEASDVVLIACASKFHPMYAEAAARAGRHVFVEKPHGIDPVGVRRMENACRLAAENGTSLMSGLQSRFEARYRAAVERIHAGAIGEVVSMQAMFLRGPYALQQRPPGMAETEYQFRNWYHFRWLSGDDVTQSLVHNVDRMAWILGEEAPAWCFGLGGRSSSFGEVYGDMYDHHGVVYEYASGPRLYALCRTQVGCYNNSGDIIMGTKGVCHLDRGRIEGAHPWRFEGPHNDPYQAEQSALIAAVRAGEPIHSGGHMNRSTLQTVMGQLSCYTGKPVRWEEILESTVEFGPGPDEAGFDTPPPSLPDESGNYPLPQPGITRFA